MMNDVKEIGKEADRLILIIGVGNEYRSDDGLGVYVARALRHRSGDGLRIIEESGEGSSLVNAWRGFPHVFIVDAVSSGNPSGTLFRWDAKAESIPKKMLFSSSHQFGVAEGVAMAKELHLLPETLMIYGIEAESFEAGVGLSESVVRHVPDLIHILERDIEAVVHHSLARNGG